MKLIDNIENWTRVFPLRLSGNFLRFGANLSLKSWESGVTQIEMAVEDLYHPLLQEAVANSFWQPEELLNRF